MPVARRCESLTLDSSFLINAAMRIFLAGASGFAGVRVLEDLVAAGHEVVALAHSERSLRDIAARFPSVTIVKGDVGLPGDMLRAVPSGTDAIIYLPGLLREFPRKGITFRAVHVEGVRNLLAVAKRSGVTRWIQMSALGAAPNASTEYYRTKWEAEELVRASGLDWTILRPSLIFDDRPRREHNFVAEVAKAIRMTPFVPILGSGKFLFQPVSLDDVSQTIVQSLVKRETIGKIYEIGGPEKMTYRELVLTIARMIGTKKPAVRIPLWLVMLLGRLPWFPISTDEVVMMRDGNYVQDPNEERKWQDEFELPMKRFGNSYP
jgi:uncharacterized protein YbjT (DUF2867 family)